MKTRLVPRLASMVALAFLVAGCGADCVSLCEDRKDCEGADRDQDCADHCKEVESLAEKASCEDQYDELLSCESEQDDICRSDENACTTESNEYSACITEYCTDHLSDCSESPST